MAFVDTISVSKDVGDEWRQFISQRRESELNALIAEEALKPEETHAFVADAFRDGAVPTAGTAITKILPPASRFSRGNDHAAKKQRVLGKLVYFSSDTSACRDVVSGATRSSAAAATGHRDGKDYEHVYQHRTSERIVAVARPDPWTTRCTKLATPAELNYVESRVSSPHQQRWRTWITFPS